MSEENSPTEYILDKTKTLLEVENLNILKKIFQNETMAKAAAGKQFDNYFYIQNLNHLRNGRYIKWITADKTIAKGAFFVEIVFDINKTRLLLKNYFGKLFYLVVNDCHIFQKLNEFEILFLLWRDEEEAPKPPK